MIGKLTKGKSFYTLISYILDPNKDAILIDSEGVLIANNRDIASSFNIQAKLNPRLSLCVGHTSLNFHKSDLTKLTNEFIVKIAKEYLDKMGIANTQYIIGRHFDKEHPHVHICYNRVNNEGKTITDKNERIRNAKITNELTVKYDLYYASGKENVKTHRLREPHKTKYEIYDIVSMSVKECNSWETLKVQLGYKGVEVSFKYRGQTADVQGVIFSKNGYTFSGSKIDASMSYSKISHQLTTHSMVQDISNGQNTSSLCCFSTVLPIFHYNEDNEELARRKKKKRNNKNNKGLSL